MDLPPFLDRWHPEARQAKGVHAISFMQDPGQRMQSIRQRTERGGYFNGMSDDNGISGDSTASLVCISYAEWRQDGRQAATLAL